MARWRGGGWKKAGTDRAGPGWGARLAVFFFGMSVLLTIALWLVDTLLKDSIAAWAESKAVNMATRAIALTLSEGLSEQIADATLAEPVLDPRGRIVGFQYDMGAINRLEAETALWIQQHLQRLARESLAMPAGQLTGLHWLAGWGPPIPIRMLPIGHVRTAPRTELTSAGINQVLHRIYVDVEINMQVVAPFLKAKLPVRQQVVLSERVIVGEVPAVFVQWGPDGGGQAAGSQAGVGKVF